MDKIQYNALQYNACCVPFCVCVCGVFRFCSNQYTDYVGTWGPAIVGHADDEVLDSIKVFYIVYLRVPVLSYWVVDLALRVLD